MTTTKTIEIIVDSTGQARVETKGFAGSACREASRFVEEALGKRTGEQLTTEFHQLHHHEPLRQTNG